MPPLLWARRRPRRAWPVSRRLGHLRHPAGPGWRVVVAGVVMLVGACTGSGADTPKAEPGAGRWKTWVLSSPSQIGVPPPPKPGSPEARREASELRRLAEERTPRMRDRAHFWGDYPAIEPWIQLNLQLGREGVKNPPRASRGYALVSVAVFDAVVATWHWKYAYDRPGPPREAAVVDPGPDPSYPSEHSAVAGAAARVLSYLFPEHPEARFEALAEEAGHSRLWAGANFRSDVEAGLALGRQVADQVIARARSDGSERVWDGRRPQGPGLWEPPPGTVAAAVEPTAGQWRTWVLSSASQLDPGPPPEYGSPRFVAEAREVAEAVRSLNDHQRTVVRRWAAGAGTSLPPGQWNEVALGEVRRSRLGMPQLARVFALLNTAQADAGVAVWSCKYTYWSPRPENAIRDLGIDPGFKPFLPTPVFPSYVSGHSGYSGAASEVLAHLFPQRAPALRDMADEAAASRLFAGIHYRSDNEAGLELGRRLGALAVERARGDGAHGPASR